MRPRLPRAARGLIDADEAVCIRVEWPPPGRKPKLFILTVFPLAVGEGIPLFAPGARRTHFETWGCETFQTGLIQRRLAKG